MIPEQNPVRPPRYRFRPRSDRFRLPRFHGEPELDVERPQPFEWSEMRDPSVWLGGFLVFLAIVVFVFAISIQDVR